MRRPSDSQGEQHTAQYATSPMPHHMSFREAGQNQRDSMELISLELFERGESEKIFWIFHRLATCTKNEDKGQQKVVNTMHSNLTKKVDRKKPNAKPTKAAFRAFWVYFGGPLTAKQIQDLERQRWEYHRWKRMCGDVCIVEVKIPDQTTPANREDLPDWNLPDTTDGQNAKVQRTKQQWDQAYDDMDPGSSMLRRVLVRKAPYG